MKLKNSLIIIIILIIIVVILLCSYFVFNKKITTKNSLTNTITNNTIENDNSLDYSKMVKNDFVNIKYEDDKYIVYNDLDKKPQVGSFLIIYDKTKKEYINEKYENDYQIITEFILIDNVYYAFIEDTSSISINIYNVTNDTFVRSFSGLEVEYKSNFVIISSGITTILDIVRAWNPKLENLEIYRNNDEMAYNTNDDTITINVEKNIYLVNSNAEIINTFEYDEVVDVYTNYIVIKENNSYYICSQSGEKIKEISEMDQSERELIVSELN